MWAVQICSLASTPQPKTHGELYFLQSFPWIVTGILRASRINWHWIIRGINVLRLSLILNTSLSCFWDASQYKLSLREAEPNFNGRYSNNFTWSKSLLASVDSKNHFRQSLYHDFQPYCSSQHGIQTWYVAVAYHLFKWSIRPTLSVSAHYLAQSSPRNYESCECQQRRQLLHRSS